MSANLRQTNQSKEKERVNPPPRGVRSVHNFGVVPNCWLEKMVASRTQKAQCSYHECSQDMHSHEYGQRGKLLNRSSQRC